MLAASLVLAAAALAAAQTPLEAPRPPRTPRFAVCFVGQLRTGGDAAIQRNLYEHLVAPLGADVFFYVSAAHEVAHASGAGGCLPSAPGSCEAPSGRAARDTAVRRGRWGSLRDPNGAAELAALEASGPLAPSIVAFEVLGDDAAVAAATALAPSAGRLHQKTLRARCKLCHAAVEARERAGRFRYDYVVRARPDYVFACRLPAAASGYYEARAAAAAARGAAGWAASHRDYWELLDRGAADVALDWLWREAGAALDDCHPAPRAPWLPAASVKSRVESCVYVALCGRNVSATGTEHFFDGAGLPKDERRAKRRAEKAASAASAAAAARGEGPHPPPNTPGVIVRPCCDDGRVNERARAPPSPATCDLDRPGNLAAWALHESRDAASWRDARARLVADLGAHCAERDRLPRELPARSDDDDDDDDDDDRGGDDDDDDDDDRSELRR